MAVLRILIAALCLAAAHLAPASAHDHAPPGSVLRSSGNQQSGRPLSSFWTTADGNLCVDSERTNSLRFPRRLPAPPGETARVVLWKRAAPVEIQLETWRELKADGSPRGAPQPVEFALVPKLRDGRTVAWKVVFNTASAPRHYYLRLKARWQDEEGCGGSPDMGYQHAAWTFHLRTRS